MEHASEFVSQGDFVIANAGARSRMAYSDVYCLLDPVDRADNRL